MTEKDMLASFIIIYTIHLKIPLEGLLDTAQDCLYNNTL